MDTGFVQMPTTTITGQGGGGSGWDAYGQALFNFGLNSISANRANIRSNRAADQQRQWLERMRATQYQTAVADLKAAGLNPMLAYTQGGAGTPSSSAAPQLGPQANSALDAFVAAANVERTREEAKSIEMGRVKMLEEISLLREQQEYSSAQSRKINQEIENLIAELVQKQLVTKREKETFSADVAQRKAESRAKQLGIPEAEAFASMWSSPYGKNVAPYLNSAGSLADVARKAGSIFLRK